MFNLTNVIRMTLQCTQCKCGIKGYLEIEEGEKEARIQELKNVIKAQGWKIEGGELCPDCAKDSKNNEE